ncbi:MAG: glycoside hydrolase family 32 protein [Lachnospiraceae bacterium]|nr:glycoside hydrolase family 32 protein [Lachnospiraceae bacterium]
MNQEYERIQQMIMKAEGCAYNDDACMYRNGFHLMPPTGWMNDPNGLCQCNGEYHIFFQYSPLEVNGGMKVWGHYVTKNFVDYEYLGAPFVPDENFDKDGVYSGSTYVDENGMHIFYTGNVKLEGKYDYTYSGRRADTVLVESKDGRNFSKKQVVIDTDEYPEGYSCHIRDPKVWEEDGTYYMVLGGRTSDDNGRILVYSSSDMHKWALHGEISSKKPFAYMWECPDCFGLDGDYVVSFSPQGLESGKYKFQNIYQSGYVVTNEKMPSVIDEETFYEWDMGFDFYAPQTFLDRTGRRILIGWAGMPDARYTNGEVDEENWQHCLTVPRELHVDAAGNGEKKVFQRPIREIESLRIGDGLRVKWERLSCERDCLDIVCNFKKEKSTEPFSITIADGVTFSFTGEEIELSLDEGCGRGRSVRRSHISCVKSIRILVDSSIIEYYINDGEQVFTTRYYKKDRGTVLSFNTNDADIIVYPMKEIGIEYPYNVFGVEDNQCVS